MKLSLIFSKISNKNDEIKLKIVTWNANSVQFKLNELKYVLFKLKIDIIGISETKLDPKKSLKIPGYSVLRHDRNEKGGGVALIIKNSIRHDQILLPVSENFETIGINLKNSLGETITIIQVYVPPSKKITKTELDKFFQNRNKVVLMGDFNAKHRA